MSDIYTVFKSHLPSCQYGFADGGIAYFVQGKYWTNNPTQIAELKKEIASGHPYFYIDPKEHEVSKADLDPMEKMRKQIRAELLAEMAAAAVANPELPDSVPQKFTPASTSDVAPLTIGGQPQGFSALQMLQAQVKAAAAQNSGE